MYALNYHRPTSLAEAAGMAGEGDAKYLGGGHTLIPAMKARLAAPSDLIDLAHIAEIKGITVSGRSIRIGAGTTHAEIAQSKEIEAVCPALTYMASHIGDPAVRHKGTIGGSVANNDPAADYPAALLAADAVIHTDRRELKAEEFFTGLFETALDEGEIVTAVSFEAPEKAGYEKFRNPASRYAMTGVFVAKTRDGTRVAVTGAGGDGVFRATGIEQALGDELDASAVEQVTVSPNGLMSDIHASAPYRANLIKVMAKRAALKARG